MNEIAFQALYERTARPLFYYLLRVSGRRDIAAFWLILVWPAWFEWFALYTSSLHVVRGMWVAVSFVAGAITALTALFGAVYILRVDRAPVVLNKTCLRN